MAVYYDCVAFKKTQSGKTFARQLGSAMKRDDGGFQVYLDAIPAAADGQIQFSILPKRERADAGPSAPSLNDDIPF